MVLKSDLKLTLFKYTVSYDETLPNEIQNIVNTSACFLKAFAKHYHQIAGQN